MDDLKITECAVCYRTYEEEDEGVYVCEYCKMKHCGSCTNWVTLRQKDKNVICFITFCDDCVEQASFLMKIRYKEYKEKAKKKKRTVLPVKVWLEFDKQRILKVLYYGSLGAYDENIEDSEDE